MKYTQWNQRLTVGTSLLSKNHRDPFWGKVVTVNVKLVLYNDTQRKRQWLDWNPTPQSIPKQGLYFVYGGTQRDWFIINYYLNLTSHRFDIDHNLI